MKTAIIALLSALVAAVAVFFIMNLALQKKEAAEKLATLSLVDRTVRKNIAQSEAAIQVQLAALADVIAANNDFSLKILVENDRSSRIITEMAAQFMHPMHFSVLEITDSAYTILSSGHFAANAGNSCAKKAANLSEKPVANIDNIMGSEMLTLQAKKKFRIAEYTFYVLGGMLIDNDFLSSIAPDAKVKLLLKQGNSYTGIDNVRSISEIKSNSMIINDKDYYASAITLPSIGLIDSLTLFVVLEK